MWAAVGERRRFVRRNCAELSGVAIGTVKPTLRAQKVTKVSIHCVFCFLSVEKSKNLVMHGINKDGGRHDISFLHPKANGSDNFLPACEC